MTNTLPIRPEQPPIEDLRNCLMIAEAWESPELSDSETQVAFGSVARLVRHALEGLGEPHPHTVELTRRYLEALSGKDVTDREARDFAMVVITSALKQEAP